MIAISKMKARRSVPSAPACAAVPAVRIQFQLCHYDERNEACPGLRSGKAISCVCHSRSAYSGYYSSGN